MRIRSAEFGMWSDEVAMILIRAIAALVVRDLEISAGRLRALCQNGSREIHLPFWQKCICNEFDACLRYFKESPQKTRSSAGARDALLQENTALLMRYFKTTSRIPERRAAAKMAGFALLQRFSRFLLVLRALLQKNCGDLHDFRAGTCPPDAPRRVDQIQVGGGLDSA